MTQLNYVTFIGFHIVGVDVGFSITLLASLSHSLTRTPYSTGLVAVFADPLLALVDQSSQSIFFFKATLIASFNFDLVELSTLGDT